MGKGGFAPGIEIHGFTALIPLVSAVQQIKQKQNETGNGNKAGQAGGSVQAKAQVSEKKSPDDNLLCPGCEKQAQCSYFNATDKLEENENNSNQLQRNYNQKIATYLSIAIAFIYLVIFISFLNKNRNDLYLLYLNL